jgi:hypothetical protein
MFAQIKDGLVVAVHHNRESIPGYVDEWNIIEVEPPIWAGWTWDGLEFHEPEDLMALLPSPPEFLNLNGITIGHAERLYWLAQQEAAAPLMDPSGKPLPGPATVLLEILGL